jgi:hypothetical protein
MAELRIPIIGEFKGKKAFDQAGGATDKLNKGVKRLGATLLAAFSAEKIIQFSKNAVKAFAENEKSARRLETVVKNLGLAFEIPGIEARLDSISAKFGLEGEVLREAFQKLITTTGSATKSQDLLNLSLDIAAGTGIDLLTVNQDLAAAYTGQTRGLRKYNLGLTQSELKTLDFDSAVEKLSNNFKGAGAQELTTYTGQMRVLGEAADNAQEIIGKNLVDSMILLSGGGNSIQPLADSMQELSIWLGDAIYGMAIMIDQLKSLPGGGILGGLDGQGFLKTYSPLIRILDQFSKQGAAARPLEGRASEHTGRPGYIDPNIGLRKQAEAAATKRAKELASLQKKTLDTQKKSLALQKASKTIDLERIGIEAALKGEISKTDRLSLNLQLALLDKNEAAALKLSNQLDAAVKRQNDLAASLLATPQAPNPYEHWKIPADLLAYTASSLGVSVSQLSAGSLVPTSGYTDAQLELMSAVNSAQRAADQLLNIQVYLDGDIVGSAVRNSSVNSSLSGSFNTVNRTNRFDLSPV